jgi:UDP-2,3-diacylglucosamine hydrolase
MDKIQFDKNAKLFFASDFHLGAPTKEISDQREKKIISWLQSIIDDADGLFLVGDIFDFWFEYKTVVPKGFVRFLAVIAQFTERGIPVYFFHGNHDLWMKDYFVKELGVTVIPDALHIEVGEKNLFVAHGDGLGPGDQTYKLLKKVFTNPLAKWLFHWLHPDIGVGLAAAWSSKSRINNIKKGGEEFQNEGEWLYQFALEKEKQSHHDYYIFGHRHLPLEMKVTDNSLYINLGEWVNYSTYASFINGSLELKTYEA